MATRSIKFFFKPFVDQEIEQFWKELVLITTVLNK